MPDTHTLVDVSENVTPIYGGGASVDYRADGQRQADDYRASQRFADWERIARGKGKPGGYGFLWWCLGVVVIVAAVTWSAS